MTLRIGAEDVAKVLSQGVKEHPFYWEDLVVALFQFAPPLSLPHTDPIGSLVRVTREALLLDERFEQDRPVAVTIFPVLSQSPSDSP